MFLVIVFLLQLSLNLFAEDFFAKDFLKEQYQDVFINGEVVLPGINSYVLGTISTIISDPRDSYQIALLASPVNIQQLKFVEVEK